ncbi:MAG: hypothetical protein ACYDDZ_10965 [Acidimicrobiales bacterium]
MDPYAAAQSNAMTSVNELTLTGNAAPGALRFGADGYGDQTQSFSDFEPLQEYEWQTGGTGAPLPLGQNKALPDQAGSPQGAGQHLRDLLGQAGL